LNWTPEPNQLVYAFFARGYKAGGVSTSGPNFNPEHLNDFELGWKGTTFNGHLQSDIDGFYMTYQDMQESVYNPANGGTQLVNLSSASKIYGLEASERGRFGQFGINASLAYLHSSLGALTAVDNGELPASATGLGQCVGGAVPPSCFNYAPYTLSLSGEPNNLSPKFSGNVMLSYTVASVTPEVTYEYTSTQYASVFQQNDYYEMGAHGQLGANVTYASGPWTLEAYGTNLTNKIYEVGNSGNAVFYGNPRQYGLRFNRSF
jgi:iron complex outermembrane receptor protein